MIVLKDLFHPILLIPMDAVVVLPPMLSIGFHLRLSICLHSSLSRRCFRSCNRRLNKIRLCSFSRLFLGDFLRDRFDIAEKLLVLLGYADELTHL